MENPSTLNQLNRFEQLCEEAVEQFQQNPENMLDANDHRLLLKLLSRMFTAEREYLLKEPEVYADIYEGG